MMLPYILAVVLAAGLDIVANLLLAKSRGFSNKKYGFSAILFVAGAFTCLAFAVRGMDLAVAYAMWGAFGILGTSLGGWALFGQKMRPLAWVGIVVVISGIALMHVS